MLNNVFLSYSNFSKDIRQTLGTLHIFLYLSYIYLDIYFSIFLTNFSNIFFKILFNGQRRDWIGVTLLRKFSFYIADQINSHWQPHRSLIEPSEMDSLHDFSHERAVTHVRAIKISTISLFWR